MFWNLTTRVFASTAAIVSVVVGAAFHHAAMFEHENQVGILD